MQKFQARSPVSRLSTLLVLAQQLQSKQLSCTPRTILWLNLFHMHSHKFPFIFCIKYIFTTLNFTNWKYMQYISGCSTQSMQFFFITLISSAGKYFFVRHFYKPTKFAFNKVKDYQTVLVLLNQSTYRISTNSCLGNYSFFVCSQIEENFK